ncbi:MAG: hypothetical protein HY897_20375 [Deltaproteobacteria bacterium]|nr:hypothetical protein [Deltaproteobacteria bacterium]
MRVYILPLSNPYQLFSLRTPLSTQPTGSAGEPINYLPLNAPRGFGGPGRSDLQAGHWVGREVARQYDNEESKIANESTARVATGYFDGFSETPGLSTMFLNNPNYHYDDNGWRWVRWYPHNFDYGERSPTPCENATIADASDYFLNIKPDGNVRVIAGDNDHDTICDEFEEYLANKYAPAYVHQNREWYWPTDPRTVPRGTMLFGNGGCYCLDDDDPCRQDNEGTCRLECGINAVWGPVHYDPVDGPIEGPLNYYSNSHWAGGNEYGFFFDIQQLSNKYEFPQLVCQPMAPLVQLMMQCGRTADFYHFHHTYVMDDGNINISYWRYYDKNEIHVSTDAADHEGDWESARVMVSPDQTSFVDGEHVHNLILARHGLDNPGTVIADSPFNQWRGLHPVVYLEEGSHAAFASFGDWLDYTDPWCKVGEQFVGEQNCYFSNCDMYNCRIPSVDACCYDSEGDPMMAWESWTGGNIWWGSSTPIVNSVNPNECPRQGPVDRGTISGHLQNFGSRLFPLNGFDYVVPFAGRWGGDGDSAQGPVYGRYTDDAEGVDAADRPLIYKHGDECFRGSSGVTRHNAWCYHVEEKRRPRLNQ